MRTRQFFVSGFALFAMFFGAGNLIFPPFLGKSGGEDWVIGFLCFFLVEVLSCVGIYAAIHGGGSVQAMNKSVGAKPGVILNTAAILCGGHSEHRRHPLHRRVHRPAPHGGHHL